MPINKATAIILAVVTAIFALFIVSYDNAESTLLIDAVVKITNNIFRGLLVVGFAMGILFTFNANGNYEAKKIAEHSLAMAVLLGFLFLAVSIAITG